MDYCQAVARKAETILGWGRDTVQAALEELPTGTARQDRYRQRGRRKAEQKLSPLEEDIRKLLDPQSQIDPKFQSSFLFTRATGKAVRESLLQNEKTYAPEEIFGILETTSCQLFTVFGTSRETSDFIVDCLQLWWDERKTAYPQIRKLQIDLDNGPELASNRTQFIKRMVQFADRNGLTIELVYYPPYHSK